VELWPRRRDFGFFDGAFSFGEKMDEKQLFRMQAEADAKQMTTGGRPVYFYYLFADGSLRRIPTNKTITTKYVKDTELGGIYDIYAAKGARMLDAGEILTAVNEKTKGAANDGPTKTKRIAGAGSAGVDNTSNDGPRRDEA
jgi:hypothetical protein